jgi:hypothetical protein
MSYILEFESKQKKFDYLKIFICLNPLIFSLIVILTDFVDYKGAFESETYISIAQNWLSNPLTDIAPQRLPIYPLFISFVFKIFGNNNFVALLISQSFLGFLSFFYLIKTLEKLKLGNNLIILLTLLFNLSINYRFSVFLPNCFFIFLITLFMYNFTSFFLSKNKKYFYFMSLFIFLMMLTRPIFQLSIILSFPIIIYFVLKQDFSNILKFQLISVLILSYFLSVGVQLARYYNAHENLAYTTQSGIHLNKWVIPCLSQKYGCGSRNMDVHKYLDKKYQLELSKDNYDEVEKNKIAMNIGFTYFFNEMNKKKMVISIFFSYTKLLLHSSLVEIYPAFNIKFKNFSLLEGNSFLEKINVLIIKTFSELKYFFWSFSIFFLFIMRFLQIIGILSIFKDKTLSLYILLIISLIFVLLIPAIGMGNPRYRSEIEPLLLILGAIGIKTVIDNYKKQ